ncbi:hypothetical protein GCM10010965_22410 [Caldalkalibacillus thermarum]|uniref:LrgB family protein n=1 Tax=Caldalkalibacillus thermarum TaxID=296745 RepID=UPI0016665856|nr:LrgB family protein [Caldalkalibacillus thermarum]GGK29078.1 hypothetical protein GCM10010965_22410 [Caldalkalibacillus thermarum]
MGTLAFQTLTITLMTSVSYVLGLRLFRQLNRTFLNPLFTATLFMVVLLSVLKIDYHMFAEGTRVFTFFLNTATVALAIPLYKQWQLLRKNLNQIVLSISLGHGVGIASAVILAKTIHLNDHLLTSLIPKSVTIPVALSLSQALGGVTSFTALFVLTSALFSITCGPKLLSLCGIKSNLAKGLALGASAQVLGATKAMKWGEEAGAMGSVGMTASAILLCLIFPLLVHIV